MTARPPTAYKVLGDNQQSCHGGHGRWVKNRWRTVKGELSPCANGIHYCRTDQLVHWLGPTIWRFEDGSPDETIDVDDKMVTRRGRIVERVEAWNDTTARLFAADCAELVLPLFERERPNDDRPRLAIEAARRFARGEIQAAALAAARAAAWAAARDAAWAAAGDAARAAARAAAWAAARDAAWDAAGDAAGDAALAAALAAAGDAAGDAALAAAWATAGDAAWAAAGDAALAAAGADQTLLLFDYLEGRRA